MANIKKDKEHYVLIVDDMSLNCKGPEKCIRNEVLRTVMVHNGNEALQTAIQTLPDRFLLDIVMPDIDGYEVCERTKQLVAPDRMAQLGTLSAGITHEINNLTAFIRGNIQTFIRFWEVAEKVIVDAIENSHEDAQRLQL